MRKTVIAGGRPWIDLSAGIIGFVPDRTWQNEMGSGSATAIRSGADLAFLLGWSVWHGRLYAGPQTSLEMIWLDWRNDVLEGQVRHENRFAATTGLRTGYQYFWPEHFFARVDLSGCVALVRYRIDAQSARSVTIFESPPGYLTLAIGVGIWF